MTVTWRLWTSAAAVGAVASVVVLALPGESTAAAVLSIVVGVLAVVASGVTAWHLPTGLRSTWWPIWLFLAVTVVADTSYQVVLHQLGEVPAPSWIDGLYLLSYAAAIVGLAALARRRQPHRDVAAWIDAIIVTLAIGAMAASLVVGPAIRSSDSISMPTLVSAAYPLLDVLILVLLATILIGPWRWNISLVTLTAGLGAFLIADFVFHLATAAERDAPVALLDALYLAGNVAIALAILSPDARTVDERDASDSTEVSLNRLIILMASAIAVPLTGLILDSADQHALSRFVSGASVIIVVLLTIRIVLLLRKTTAQSRILASQARTDALTGLPNRRTWDYQLERAVQDATTHGTRLTIAMIDLDYFKRYNDTHGHQAGDQLLATAATAWSAEIGASAFLARYGGEEFSIAIPGTTSAAAMSLLERIRSATPEPLTASIGVATLEPGESGSDVVRRADGALYAAKADGRNRIVVGDGRAKVRAAFTVGLPPPTADAPLVGAEDLLRLMLDTASDIVYRTSGLEIDWISPSVTKHLGWEPDDLIGGPAAALVSPNQDLTWMQANRDRLYAGETVYQELLLTAKDGEERWFGGTAHPNVVEGKVTGFSVAMNDIQSRWLARTELAALEELVRVASTTAQHGVAFLSADGCVIEVNTALRDFIGLPTHELIGRRWISLVHPEDARFEDDMLGRLMAGSLDSYRLTSRYLRPDGTVVRGEASAAAVRGPDRQPGRIIIQVIDVSDEHASRDRLAQLARTDPTTGLLSRTAVLNELDLSIQGIEGGQTRGTVLLEVSNLGVINETLGHQAGDDVVRAVASRLTAAAPAGSVVGRSGKRFMIVAPGNCSEAEMLRIAMAAVTAASAEVRVDSRRITPVFASGVVVAGRDSDALGVLRNAHIALSEARRAHADAPVLFEPSLAASLENRLTVEEDLREALLKDQFVLEYQPVVRLSTGAIESFEALIRWQHPSGSLRAPADFLRVAEESRLIRHIGAWVLKRVCRDLHDHPDVLRHVAINVSAVEIQAEDWLPDVLSTIRGSGIDPTRLTIEVTETAVFSVSRDVVAEFDALRGLGVGIVMDDFGTGYSSLSLLRDLPVTGVKLDRSFVLDMGGDTGAESALAQGLIGLANALELTGVAEGIETPLQAVHLRTMGWHFGQGFLFGRPARIEQWISGVR